MMNMIKKNPTVAAVFYFILTWAGFPIAALLGSYLKGITFAAACCTPYLIATFALGSVVAAVQMYFATKNSAR